MYLFSFFTLMFSVVLVVMAFIMKKYPPKYKKSLYGYRTAIAEKSEKNWNFAQNCSAKSAGKFAILSFCISLLATLIKGSQELNVICIFLYLIALFYFLVFKIEKAIYNFDKSNSI